MNGSDFVGLARIYDSQNRVVFDLFSLTGLLTTGQVFLPKGTYRIEAQSLTSATINFSLTLFGVSDPIGTPTTDPSTDPSGGSDAAPAAPAQPGYHGRHAPRPRPRPRPRPPAGRPDDRDRDHDHDHDHDVDRFDDPDDDHDDDDHGHDRDDDHDHGHGPDLDRLVQAGWPPGLTRSVRSNVQALARNTRSPHRGPARGPAPPPRVACYWTP